MTKEGKEPTDTIRVYESDKERIAREGSFNESWADVVRRILDEREALKREKEVHDRNPLMALMSEPIPA
jgi:hypothetical protein